MNGLLSIPVALPLIGAAFVAVTDGWTPRAVKDFPAMLIAAATAVVSIAIVARSERMTLVHWFGGWQPRHGLAIGIGFVVEPLGAGMAALAGVIVTAALAFSWHYMDDAPRLYRVLMLVFLAGMSGFALSGDLFNMFVWFELMGVAAYALAGYMAQELGPLQGALNFAITNSVGAFMLLFGIALLYGRTGALNLAQIGRTLDHLAPDGLVVVAFTLVVAAFFVKSALAPFHFWLSDAYAVAPAPVCLVFASLMSEVGLFGIARVYWTVFAGPFGSHEQSVRDVLLVVGVGTALVGAVMAFLQRHLKRLLAFTVIAHIGVVLCGIAMLTDPGLAAAAHLVLSHAFLTGGLFLACGALGRQFRTVDELRLRGLGRSLPILGAAFGIAALALSGFPYVGDFLGHALLDDALVEHGQEWVAPLVMVATGVSAGAVLRAAARVFVGWGPAEDPLLTPEPSEGSSHDKANLPVMVTITALLVVVGVAMSVVPGLQDRLEHGADRFRDRHAYVEQTLFGRTRTYGRATPAVVHRAQGYSIALGLGSAAIAFVTAAFGLFRRRLPGSARDSGGRALEPSIATLKALHSGIVGDYVMWITVGTAVLGGVWALTLRGP
jgi:multicomponent Na+:H+ antiporter subunit D